MSTSEFEVILYKNLGLRYSRLPGLLIRSAFIRLIWFVSATPTKEALNRRRIPAE